MYSIDIREFRRANKMTQQELADYFGVVQGFISNMENGREKVPDKYISKILGDPNVDSSMVKAVAPENEVKMPREVFDKFSLLLETISSQQGTIADQQKVNAENRPPDIIGESHCPHGRRCRMCRCKIVLFGLQTIVIPKY